MVGRAVDHFSEWFQAGPFDPTRGRDASYSLKRLGATGYYVIWRIGISGAKVTTHWDNHLFGPEGAGDRGRPA
jgi:hypothetical protein